ncbi:sugar phosphate isomerase/epimerase [Shimia sp.]|uniref:sugar phosphate isomerase/epimerase family protein n=1 Tax=Shimia sp. TaxID=1954381 RepID=UPI003297D18E
MTSISYQLYGSRNWPLDETMSMVSRAGYTQVEGYGALLETPDPVLAALDASGLRMTTAHFGLETLESDASGPIALAKRLGLEAIFAPYIAAEDRPEDLAGWQAFAARLVEAGKPLQDAGLTFGWHNHDFELVDLGNGITPLNVIAEASPDLCLELDLGWVIRAGGDPLDAIGKFAGQINAAHIKDIAPQGENLDEDGWADVGHGTVDWAPIHAALQKAGVKRYVVEHDNPNDHQRFAERSLKTVSDF